MNEQLIQTIKQLESNKAPEEQSLEAANQNYTKKQLAHFIERHDLSIAKSWKKAEIVTALTEWMEQARIDLLNSNEELLSFYSQNLMQAEQPLDLYSDTLTETELERVLLLIEHGVAYNVDGKLWMPDETVGAVTNKAAASEEQAETVTTQSDSLKKKPAPSSQTKQHSQPTSLPVSTEEKMVLDKQRRLKYLKKQAKKKK